MNNYGGKKMFLASILDNMTHEHISVMVSQAELFDFLQQVTEKNSKYELINMLTMKFITFEEFQSMFIK
jgi:hypothetical protein